MSVVVTESSHAICSLGLELDVLVLIVCIVCESNSYQFECNEVYFEMDNSYNEHD